MKQVLRFMIEIIILKIRILWTQIKKRALAEEIKERKEEVEKIHKDNSTKHDNFRRKYERFKSRSKYGVRGVHNTNRRVRKNGSKPGNGDREAERADSEAGRNDRASRKRNRADHTTEG